MTRKKALLLLSGGIDSPVAGKLLQMQGFEVSAVHFSIEPFTDDSSTVKSKQLAARLGLAQMWLVPAGPLFAKFTQGGAHRLYFVLSKRYMAMVATRLAERIGCTFLATGENLGQVSSQTLTNLVAIDAAAGRPVLRPLLAYDKTQIVDLARRFDTFETSKGPEMCDVLGPKHPATSSTLKEVLGEEAKLDLEALVEEGVRLAALVPTVGDEPTRAHVSA